ncbi:BsuBI/PstI family type II restriction endonuclease [Dolichospermum planctonicum CS-1226]|uniref:BsuBI/PstI family type II restriction endonuclease n=1 Tax=Dolichospermum planctonicum CS-1226 TaxID=3021751 RepID=A0ABT5AI94_9CYAN|nr:BsuBI/PstI family type II restriction endonuclease [Dolichospermum planctonicum]MDB9537012.1 BsuBI/PstI family type II restriction endonuclease [Dolichospermum planctonicum CS-1226]
MILRRCYGNSYSLCPNLDDLGVELDPHGKMPAVVVYHQKQDWLILIEVLTSHGLVNFKRHN